MENNSKVVDLEKIKDMNNIVTSWEDYMYVLLNSSQEPTRTIWREKIVTSITHWKGGKGSISEASFSALQLLSELPDKLTDKIVNYAIDPEQWEYFERLNRSKRMNVRIGVYPQESLTEMARKVCVYIANGILNHDIEMIKILNESPSLKKIWDYAQYSNAQAFTDDEILTLILEKPVDNDDIQPWIGLADKMLKEGHSGKYSEYYKHDKLEGYPFKIEEMNAGDGDAAYTITVPITDAEGGELKDKEEKLKQAVENFNNVVNVWFKEDIHWSPNYKKICVAILKNDISLKYCGFGPTQREILAREQAFAAFDYKKNQVNKLKKQDPKGD